MNDLRYAFRQLLKSPGFALIAVLTLALGIGASTAIFSVLDAVLLRPLPYPQQERLVELRELDENGKGMEFAQPNFDDLRTRSRSFEAIAKYAGGPEAVIGGSEPLQTNVCAVSGDFFSVLAVRPVLGRFFSSKSLTENKQVAVVSFGFWKRLLGGRTDLAGTTLRLENRSFAVVGVLPAEREFPPDVDVWIPTEIYPPGTSRAAHSWHVVARLRNGVSIKQARTEIASIGRRLKGEYGKQTNMVSFGLSPLRDRLVKDVRGMLLVLAGAVALVLVIACSNVANLLLVRTTVRHKEIALRAALGASRWRLARQFLVETMLLKLCAGALGVLFAFWGVDLMVGLYHGDLPRVGEIGVNIPVLLFSLGLSVVVGISLGLVPVLGTSSQHLQSHLQNAGRGLTPGSSGTRGRNLLIVFQVALTLMLLVGAGLLGRSFQRLLAVDPGFQPESAVAMSLWTQFSQEPAAQRQPAQFYHKLIERLQTLPGVIAVGGINFPPLSDYSQDGTFLIEDGSKPARNLAELEEQLTTLSGTGKTGDAEYRVASAGYFRAMGIPLLRGRLFQESDGPDSPNAAVINESLARRYWPNEDPIGRQIQFGNIDGDLRLLHVVGVVGDAREQRLEAEPHPTVYADYFQRRLSPAGFTFVLRARGNAASQIGAMRREVHALNPEAAADFHTLEQLVSSRLDNRRFSMVILGVFAGVALLLAMVGLYGIMAYITAQRTTEIGVRMALGAQRADVLRLVLRQSVSVVAIGLVVGLLAAFTATRLLASMLYGVGANDPLTFLGVTLLLTAAALLATYVPAHRATKVDPMVALRHE